LGCGLPDITTSSHAVMRPLTANASTRPRRPRASMVGGCSSRRSRMPTTSTPAAARSAAATRPRSSAVTTTARSAGLIDHRLTRRRAPSGSITPTRSLPGKTRGCSIVPAATTTLPARIFTSVSPCATGTRPYSKTPIATAGARSSTPAASACRRSSTARSRPLRSARSIPPTSGPSSTRTTRSSCVAAAIAASSPASPPPMTTTSACSWTTSTRPLGAPSGSSFPRPAAPRRIFS
jgi:hypothetical protein